MHERFHYRSLDQLKEKASQLQIELPFAETTEILKEELRLNKHIVLPNRLGIAPMEGADALADGSPSEKTLKRYMSQAIGGSAIIWLEAISIVKEGRSSSHQLLLTKENADQFKVFINQVKQAGFAENGYEPYMIMQANHSGRYSNPNDKPDPIIAYRHPEYEKLRPADDCNIVTDDYLKGLEDKFEEATKLAKEVGFDAVDIKSCHGYLLTELTSAYERKGEYGGDFINRTRLLRNAIGRAKMHETISFAVTSRLGIYDGFAYPYGFGVTKDGENTVDLSEPIALLKTLNREYGVDYVNLTMGNPYVNSHVTRPFDMGKYEPTEHPLIGINRMIQGIGEVKAALPNMSILASAPTYLRQYSDLFTAGAVEQGLCDGMLFGRMSFANSNFANDIIHNGRVSEDKVCVACGKCGDLIRAGKPTGCVIRNSAEYMKYYKEFMEELQ